MVQFILKMGKGLEEPDHDRRFTSALTMGIAYFIGGFIPLLPYFFTTTVQRGLYVSSPVMAATLFMFGVMRTLTSIGSENAGRWRIIREGFKMMLIGGVAAASAYGLVKVIDTESS